LGPKGINERNRESFLLDIADEQIENIGQAVMGLSVGCARCHDHKFDPVTMGDYYALAGIFRSSDARVGISNRQQVIGQPIYLVELRAAGASLARLADPRLVATIKALEKERQTKQDELRRLREKSEPEVLAAVPAVTPDQNALAAIPNAGTNGQSSSYDELGPDPKPGPPPVPASFENMLRKQRAFFKLTRKLNTLKDQLGR
jgi:hypothetical protein